MSYHFVLCDSSLGVHNCYNMAEPRVECETGIEYGPAVLLGSSSIELFRTLKELRCTTKTNLHLKTNCK
jgi:hypothetical protein